MASRELIAIGASAGGLEPLLAITRKLPGDLPAAVAIVVHTSAKSSGGLWRLLAKESALPAAQAMDGQAVQPGRIYTAQPDRHLLIKDGVVRSVYGPRENGFRPAIDPLFRTAAHSYGPRAIGVVLSGGMDDGAYGLSLIKQRGGATVVQDPEEALVPGMPRSAIEHVEVDHVLPTSRIAEKLVALAAEPIEGVNNPGPGGSDGDPAVGEPESLPRVNDQPPSAFTCPECGGSLWELTDGGILRYRCHVGHAFTARSLLDQQQEGLEASLWSALRALEERAGIYHRIARRYSDRKQEAWAQRYRQQVGETDRHADILREALIRGSTCSSSRTGS